MPDHPHEVTKLLTELGQGKQANVNRLIEILFDELHALAANAMRDQPESHTLQPTALLHEAYLKLVKSDVRDVKNRGHFLAIAATAMRQILVDHARNRLREKRGAGAARSSLDHIVASFEEQKIDVVAMHDALEKLAVSDPQAATLVERHVFAGASMKETAEHIGMPLRTAERSWAHARAWLRVELGGTSSRER